VYDDVYDRVFISSLSHVWKFFFRDYLSTQIMRIRDVGRS
jgi:hypothetical protein